MLAAVILYLIKHSFLYNFVVFSFCVYSILIMGDIYIRYFDVVRKEFKLKYLNLLLKLKATTKKLQYVHYKNIIWVILGVVTWYWNTKWSIIIWVLLAPLKVFWNFLSIFFSFILYYIWVSIERLKLLGVRTRLFVFTDREILINSTFRRTEEEITEEKALPRWFEFYIARRLKAKWLRGYAPLLRRNKAWLNRKRYRYVKHYLFLWGYILRYVYILVYWFLYELLYLFKDRVIYKSELFACLLFFWSFIKHYYWIFFIRKYGGILWQSFTWLRLEIFYGLSQWLLFSIYYYTSLVRHAVFWRIKNNVANIWKDPETLYQHYYSSNFYNKIYNSLFFWIKGSDWPMITTLNFGISVKSICIFIINIFILIFYSLFLMLYYSLEILNLSINIFFQSCIRMQYFILKKFSIVFLLCSSKANKCRKTSNLFLVIFMWSYFLINKICIVLCENFPIAVLYTYRIFKYILGKIFIILGFLVLIFGWIILDLDYDYLISMLTFQRLWELVPLFSNLFSISDYILQPLPAEQLVPSILERHYRLSFNYSLLEFVYIDRYWFEFLSSFVDEWMNLMERFDELPEVWWKRVMRNVFTFSSAFDWYMAQLWFWKINYLWYQFIVDMFYVTVLHYWWWLYAFHNAYYAGCLLFTSIIYICILWPCQIFLTLLSFIFTRDPMLLHWLDQCNTTYIILKAYIEPFLANFFIKLNWLKKELMFSRESCTLFFSTIKDFLFYPIYWYYRLSIFNIFVKYWSIDLLFLREYKYYLWLFNLLCSNFYIICKVFYTLCWSENLMPSVIGMDWLEFKSIVSPYIYAYIKEIPIFIWCLIHINIWEVLDIITASYMYILLYMDTFYLNLQLPFHYKSDSAEELYNELHQEFEEDEKSKHDQDTEVFSKRPAAFANASQWWISIFWIFQTFLDVDNYIKNDIIPGMLEFEWATQSTLNLVDYSLNNLQAAYLGKESMDFLELKDRLTIVEFPKQYADTYLSMEGTDKMIMIHITPENLDSIDDRKIIEKKTKFFSRKKLDHILMLKELQALLTLESERYIYNIKMQPELEWLILKLVSDGTTDFSEFFIKKSGLNRDNNQEFLLFKFFYTTATHLRTSFQIGYIYQYYIWLIILLLIFKDFRYLLFYAQPKGIDKSGEIGMYEAWNQFRESKPARYSHVFYPPRTNVLKLQAFVSKLLPHNDRILSLIEPRQEIGEFFSIRFLKKLLNLELGRNLSDAEIYKRLYVYFKYHHSVAITHKEAVWCLPEFADFYLSRAAGDALNFNEEELNPIEIQRRLLFVTVFRNLSKWLRTYDRELYEDTFRELPENYTMDELFINDVINMENELREQQNLANRIFFKGTLKAGWLTGWIWYLENSNYRIWKKDRTEHMVQNTEYYDDDDSVVELRYIFWFFIIPFIFYYNTFMFASGWGSQWKLPQEPILLEIFANVFFKSICYHFDIVNSFIDFLECRWRGYELKAGPQRGFRMKEDEFLAPVGFSYRGYNYWQEYPTLSNMKRYLFAFYWTPRINHSYEENIMIWLLPKFLCLCLFIILTLKIKEEKKGFFLLNWSNINISFFFKKNLRKFTVWYWR